MSSPSIFPLIAFSQPYDWGKLGSSSKVAQYAVRNQSLTGFKLEEGKPYAELWMGTHPTLPSKLEDGTTLSEHIRRHPEVLGSELAKDLPFLFKVLAIGKALSIQSHPDKKMAERLHREQPHIYKDPNHKPEMAIALTPFRALCGFRPISQISLLLSVVPELGSLIPHSIVHSFLSSSPPATLPTAASKSPLTQPEPYSPSILALLKSLFASLMTAEPSSVQAALKALMERYGSSVGPSKVEKEAGLVDLAKMLNEQFPGDVGVFCIYLLNVVDLEPGEAIFLGAGEPHAYVSGDIIECMATSDNVLRAGLTPKARDVPNLLASLTYTPAPPAQHMVYPRPFAGGSTPITTSSIPAKTHLYDPPVPEFSVLRVGLTQEGEEESHKALGGPSVLIVTEGTGKIVQAPRVQDEEVELEVLEGSVIFVGAGVPVKFISGQSLVVYRAFYEA